MPDKLSRLNRRRNSRLKRRRLKRRHYARKKHFDHNPGKDFTDSREYRGPTAQELISEINLTEQISEMHYQESLDVGSLLRLPTNEEIEESLYSNGFFDGYWDDLDYFDTNDILDDSDREFFDYHFSDGFNLNC